MSYWICGCTMLYLTIFLILPIMFYLYFCCLYCVFPQCLCVSVLLFVKCKEIFSVKEEWWCDILYFIFLVVYFLVLFTLGQHYLRIRLSTPFQPTQRSCDHFHPVHVSLIRWFFSASNHISCLFFRCNYDGCSGLHNQWYLGQNSRNSSTLNFMWRRK